MRLVPALRVLVPVMGLLLIGSTWRLWFPVTDFPVVPLIGVLVDVPVWSHFVASAGLVASLVGVAVFGMRARGSDEKRSQAEQRCRVALFSSAGFLCASVLLNQHCLQVWAWHLFLMLPVLAVQSDEERDGAGLNPDVVQNSLVTLMAGIYAWSAVSRLDVVFLNSLGPQMLDAFGDSLPTQLRFQVRGHQRQIVTALPVAELLIAVMIVSRPLRGFGLLLSLGMHSLLLVVLGPFGMNHKPGVLIWNVSFLMQNSLLLWFRRNSPDSRNSSGDCTVVPRPGPVRWTNRLAFLVVGLSVVMPVFRFVDRFDNWPSWAVYSPGASRTVVMIQDRAAHKLPGELKKYLVANFESPEWSYFRMDRWSLDALNAPIYPQDRFQAAIAVYLARKHGLGNSIRVTHESRADSLTGDRRATEYVASEEIERLAGSFRLNAVPARTR